MLETVKNEVQDVSEVQYSSVRSHKELLAEITKCWDMNDIAPGDPLKLRNLRDVVIGIRQKYDSHSLSKSLRALQEASRVQEISTDLRQAMLQEMSSLRMIKEIVDGESFQ